MATIKLTIECATPQEAQAILAKIGTPANGNGAAQPQPQNFLTPNAPTVVAPYTAPVPTSDTQHTIQSVAALMQQYAAKHKTAGTKAAFAKFGLPSSLPQLDAKGLNTMAQFFTAMEPA